jgi:hypothetical protein
MEVLTIGPVKDVPLTVTDALTPIYGIVHSVCHIINAIKDMFKHKGVHRHRVDAANRAAAWAIAAQPGFPSAVDLFAISRA